MHIDIGKVPIEMKQYPQWVLWKLEKLIDKKTNEPILDEETGEPKYTKVPYSINGYKASSTNSKSRTNFEDVLQAFQLGGYDGIGFVFSEEDPFTGIDLDDCFIDGELTAEAASTISMLNSYTELSPSGEGVHVIVKGDVPGERSRKGKYEMYDSKRFFTVTGHHIPDTPTTIEERQQELNKLYESIFNDVQDTQDVQQEEETSPAMEDDEIMNIALKASNSETFKKLFTGDIGDYGNDHSTADLALCNILAFYTQDEMQIDRMFRNSGLMRDKWNRQDYSSNTISKAIQDTQKRYKVFEKEAPKDVFTKASISQDGHNQYDFNVPSQFKAVGDTLFQTVKRGKEFYDEMVLRALPFIEAELVNMERSQMLYRVGWSTLNNGRRVTKEVVPASSISTRRELLQLSDKGLPVNDNNAKAIITYFDQFLAVNEVERVKAVERLGLVGRTFISPLHENTTEIITLDQGEKQTLEAFEIKGSSEEWVANVFNPIKENPVAVFVIASSFASVLLGHLNMKPFIVDLSGTTSTGKSTISRIAGSVWGKESYISEWNLTRVALERKAAFLNSFPLILDDTRKANQFVLNDVIYHFSGGRGKGRGSIKGSQKEMTWNNILISNGEVPLNDYARDKGGVSARNISFTDRPLQNADYKLFNMIYENVDQYYGAIGKEFINVWESNKKELITKFAACKKYFNEKAGSNEILARLSNSYSVIYFTCQILKDYLSMNIDLQEIENLMDTLKENENLDKPLQMLDKVLSHVDGSRNSGLNDEVNWIYKADEEQLYILPKFVNDLLDVESHQIRREWLNRGIVLEGINRGKKTDTRTVRDGSKVRRALAINMNLVNELGYNFKEIVESAEDDFLK